MSTKKQIRGAEEYFLRVPQLFEQMLEADPIVIHKWHIHEQDILHPGAPLLQAEACVGYINIPVPPQSIMPGLHRVVKIARPEGTTVYLHDLLLVLQAIPGGAA